MIEKPKRPKKLNNQDRKIPINIQELINRYDLENIDIYDYLDKLVSSFNIETSEIENKIETKTEKNIITAYSSGIQTVNDNTVINLTAFDKVGDKLSLNNNRIVIGSGVSHIKVSGTIFFQGFEKGTGYFFSTIRKNDEIVSHPITQKGVSGSAGFQSIWFIDNLIEVEQGDTILMDTRDINNAQATVRHGRDTTYLTVEVVD